MKKKNPSDQPGFSDGLIGYHGGAGQTVFASGMPLQYSEFATTEWLYDKPIKNHFAIASPKRCEFVTSVFGGPSRKKTAKKRPDKGSTVHPPGPARAVLLAWDRQVPELRLAGKGAEL